MAIDREKLIDKIKTLDGLTMQERNDLIAYLREQKVYGLVWEDKPEAVETRLRTELPVLKEVKSRAIISENPDAPNHILIEGDNLEALTTLTYTHEGKIDVIYIDPPYNTGNQDFVYNDKYIDREDDYRHSKWLSFMSKRLRIAKRLLSDRGVIFISIDDNEQAQLKLLCDEIFNSANFVGTYFWKRTATPPALSYKIRRKLEFVLCYQKSEIPQRTFAQGYVDGGDAPLLNSGNPLGTLTFPAGTVHFNIPDGTYSNSIDKKIHLLDDVIVVNGLNENAFRAEANFKWGQANLENEVSRGTYFLIKTAKFSPRFQKAEKSTKVPSNIIDQEVNVGTNEDANAELEALKLNEEFNFAKPVSLISYLIKMPLWDERNYIVLDFFAGSGTTLHATMQLNSEDGGKRRCILVTNNENGICENVTYERNKRVIKGYTTPKGEHVAGLTDNNLRYYRTAFVGRRRTPQNMRRLMLLASDMLCIKENIYTEVDDFGGMNTIENGFRYFANDEQQMLIIYDETAIYKIVDSLLDMQVEKKIITYVFSPANDPWRSEFADVADKVNLTALPAAIYNAYKRVLPKPDFDGHKEETESEETESLGGLFDTAEEGGEV